MPIEKVSKEIIKNQFRWPDNERIAVKIQGTGPTTFAANIDRIQQWNIWMNGIELMKHFTVYTR